MYIQQFNGFDMYGSLTTIVIVMLWLYFCFYLFLIGFGFCGAAPRAALPMDLIS